MKIKNIKPDASISFFVANIISIESNDSHKQHRLPFYADGYPGIMFQETKKGLYVLPQNKKMPDLFLYGQTLQPIELKIEGAFKLIVFQLYPFVIEGFFDIDPQSLNDGCYDLQDLQHINAAKEILALKKTPVLKDRIGLISNLLYSVFQLQKQKLDHKIRQGILKIIETNGMLPIKTLREILNISERTFERRFLAQVGVTPKQFSKIIQFQSSLTDLQKNDFNKLTDVVYKNGFADQSHFIRVFKAFTGTTPSSYKTKSR
jgi:AraC-like DNA-binding protein